VCGFARDSHRMARLHNTTKSGGGVTHRDMESDVDAGLDRDLACPIPFCDAARWRRPLNDAGAWNGVAMGSMAAAMAHPASDFAAIVCDFFEDLSSISLS